MDKTPSTLLSWLGATRVVCTHTNVLTDAEEHILFHMRQSTQSWSEHTERALVCTRCVLLDAKVHLCLSQEAVYPVLARIR